MNILIVEDDITLASSIADTFAACVITNQITIISCPLDFIRQLDRVEIYDIVITDLILSPDTQDLWGYRVIEILREKGISIPIIVMSGRGDIDILRAAFHRGATDYLIKPFRLRELEVRVYHWFQNYCFPILKNTMNLSPDRLVYNTERNEFSIDGSIMILSRLQKYLFFIFFSNPGKLLSPQFLREKVWGDYEDSPERNLRVSILRLRRTLDMYKLSESIMTIRGEGYIFQP